MQMWMMLQKGLRRNTGDLTTIASLEDLQSVDQGLQTVDTATSHILPCNNIVREGVINTKDNVRVREDP